jgi:hypothetical protein
MSAGLCPCCNGEGVYSSCSGEVYECDNCDGMGGNMIDGTPTRYTRNIYDERIVDECRRWSVPKWLARLVLRSAAKR